jgi:molecular chaperone GrpE
MDASTKAELLERFSGYLDTLDEAPPDEAEAGVIDLYTLFTELAGLRSEIKLESRQVKQALDHSRELIDALQENNNRLAEELGSQRRAEDALREEAERNLLLEVLELRDRLATSSRAIADFRPGGLLTRPRGRTQQLIDGMGQGLDIGLRRLDTLLQRYGVRPCEAIGQRLDPKRMQAASIDCDPTRENGIVLSEIRKGYLRGDQVLRLAEVVVNKREFKP